MMWLRRYTPAICLGEIEGDGQMTKKEMLDAICDLGYYPYNSEFDCYEEVRKEFISVTKEARRIGGRKAVRDLFRRD